MTDQTKLWAEVSTRQGLTVKSTVILAVFTQHQMWEKSDLS